ncbi:MAG: UDP-glucose 6-dehydrogenase, partial [Alteraurantiacibacter sp.]|nr:UDP-glucose 6-dehydrogenase [Alteraurantiacibacter sp.]
GSCFPKDTLALLKTGQDYGAPLQIVDAVVRVNAQRKQAMGGKVIAALGGDTQGKTVALLGLTFKADTDDMRDSPAIDIARSLKAAGITLRAYDPEGMETSKAVIDGLVYCHDTYDALTGADAAVIVTEWDAFRAIDLDLARGLMNRPLLVDLRNLYSRSDVERHGFEYVAVGR